MSRKLFQRIRRIKIENAGLKALSILVAALLFIVSKQPAIDIRFSGVPLEFRGLDPDMQISSSSEQTVSVRLQGPRDQLRSLNPGQISVIANLSDKQSGDRIVQLRPEDVTVPDNLVVLQIDPPTIRLKLELKAIKTVQIEPHLVGKVSPDYEVYGVIANPSAVEIEGPKSKIEQIAKVSTETIDLSGKTGRFQANVDVETPHDSLIVRGKNRVIVTIEIGEQRTNRLFSDLPLNWLNPVAGYKLQTKTMSVNLYGPVSALESITRDNLRLEIRTENLNSEVESITPRVILPAGIDKQVQINNLIPKEARLKRQ
ncbi:MAG: hypothetical protein IPO77_07850 [Acidobacteria bacterium]|nr:hypothetical protein [Acidobacteriota bacterium]